MAQRSAAESVSGQRIIVIGDGQLVDVVRRTLEQAGAQVVYLRHPSDRAIRQALAAEVDAVMVICSDDRASLRSALVVESLREGVRLIVTIYNRDLGAQLRRAVRNVRVMSMAEIVAPSLAAACLSDELLSVLRTDERVLGVRRGRERPEITPLAVHPPTLRERWLANLMSLLHAFELSARTLLLGLVGFAAILVIDSTVVSLARHESAIEALYGATKTIATVGPSPAIDTGPGWLKLYAVASMLAALAFTAVFLAGLIDRLLDRRLVAIVGPRAMPRKDHVVVVGLGQVGLRLAMMLQNLGVPVIAVEHDPATDNIRRARQYNIPVVIGRGSSRAVLGRLRLDHARALAAVTSDEIENISTAMASLAISAELRTVLRAGSGDVLDETRALFRIGAVRDVYQIGGILLAVAALGSSAHEVFVADDTVWVIRSEQQIEPIDIHLQALRTGA
ncbi:MAG: NAD-binding protein [Solirubrobacteraceae bacterium]